MSDTRNAFDLVIIGAGPAGYTASIYASRYRISNIVIGSIPGGLATEAHNVCNFPTEIGLSGIELMQKMKEVVEHNGSEIVIDEVISVEKADNGFTIKTGLEKEFNAKSVLIATGTHHKKLGAKGELSLLGKGVSYCATCDGPFYKDKVVGVIGGANAANMASLYLSGVAEKVYQFVRSTQKGDQVLIDSINKKENVEVFLGTEIESILGEERVTGVRLKSPYNGQSEIALDGVFIEVGTTPASSFTQGLQLTVDESGYIVVEPDQSTNVSGVWAAGDITTNSNKYHQIITACSEGAIAASSIAQWIRT